MPMPALVDHSIISSSFFICHLHDPETCQSLLCANDENVELVTGTRGELRSKLWP